MREVTFQVPDMNCGHCERRIRSVLEGQLGCVDVDIRLPEKRVRLQTDRPFEEIREALAVVGYTAQAV